MKTFNYCCPECGTCFEADHEDWVMRYDDESSCSCPDCAWPCNPEEADS